MKKLLLVLPVVFLASCAGSNPKVTNALIDAGFLYLDHKLTPTK